ncbi:glycine zipper 2TM domain-containing protein [Elongatibacter sediminis]|uniref:Glycine zipper 2TM domain-containing protein n=1 Tax=Elongatibacter sediminis TaxID=3119006 RepID=A0AAW9RI88_9GAMM
MNRQLVIGGVIGAVAATAIAGVAGTDLIGFGDYADVVSVEPVTRTVTTPREVCGDELVTTTRPVKDEHRISGTIAGAVIGGVLGNQIGDGSGQDIATAGGAVAGGYAGNTIQKKIQEGNTEQRVEHVCQTVHETEEIQNGYHVTYRIEGETRVVHMEHDPGSRIEIENGEPVLDS